MPQEEYLQFGGMAVVEGVMMRSPHYWAVACRAPNGDIVIKTEPLEQTWIGKQKWLKKPFLRGTLALLDTMGLGMRAMRYASDVQVDEKYLPEEERTKSEEERKKKKAVEGFAIGATVVVSLALSFAIFDFSPEIVAQLTQNWLGLSGTGANAVAEILKLAMFIGYLFLIRRLPPILEVFRYHGAEHQAINTIEAKLDLTTDHCLAQTRLHPRCGTNFAIMVILIGFLVFIPIPRNLFVGAGAPDWLVVIARMLIKLAILPVVAGVSYEIIRLAGKMKDQRWVNMLLKPGLMTQFITTEEPEAKHADVAIQSLKAVMLAEETGELTNTEIPADDSQPDASPAPAL